MRRIPKDLYTALVAWRRSLIINATCTSKTAWGKVSGERNAYRAQEIEAHACARVAATMSHWEPEGEEP